MANKGITPYKLLFKRAPNYEHLRTFGCLCYKKNDSKGISKFDPRDKMCIFIGYPQGQKGWKVYSSKTRECFISINVVFYEHIFPYHVQNNNRSTNFRNNSSSDNLNGESSLYSDAELEVPSLEEIPPND